MRKIILFLMVAILFSCNNSEPNTKENNEEKVLTENFDWMLGSWRRVNEKEDRATYENWQKKSENEYIGMGLTIKDFDTISQENILLIKRNNIWNLEVIIKGSTEATVFPVVQIKANMFVCKNDENEFPKKIHYFMEKDQLKAIISGGGPVIPFDFERVK